MKTRASQDFDDDEWEEALRSSNSSSASEDERPKKKSKTLDRGNQNLSLKDCQEADRLRLQSLAPHRNVLRPFVRDNIFSALTNAVDRSKLKSEFLELVVEQPKTVKNCVMRSYQLEGLSWMVGNYEKAINCILGDEMGLGSKAPDII
jgi:SNF2 family DNA or RNA helicase